MVEGNVAVFTCIAEENDMILPPGNIEWRFRVPSMGSIVPSTFLMVRQRFWVYGRHI